MSQPFDTAPFRQVRVPAWVQETIGCGYTLSGMDSKARAAAAAHGVTISEMGFVDPFYPYYDSKLLKKRSPHVPLGRLEKDIAEYQKLGVRILGVYPPCLQGEVYENHPDWRRIATDTTEIPQIDMKKYPHGGMLCLLGPYGDFFIDVLAEILTKYPAVDAFSFDGLHYGGVCYCQHCRDNYRKAAGAEIPKTDMNDPAFRRYQHWADRRMEDLVRRMQDRLKRIKPDVALVTWTTNAGRFGHFLSIPRNMPARMNLLLDAPDQEFWLDETNRGTTIVPAFANAYIWATTNHRTAFSEPYILSHGNPYGKDSFPPQEILRRMLLTLTYGAAPSIAVGQPPNLQQRALRLSRRGQAAQALAHAQEARALGGAGHERQHPQLLRPRPRAGSRSVTWPTSSAPSAPRSRNTCVLTVINDWNLNPDRPRAVQGPDPAQHRMPRRRPGRGGRAVRRAGRRPGRQPRCLAVRRVRQPPRRTSPWHVLRGRAPRADRRTGRATRGARRELRQVHRAGLLGKAQECVRLQAGRRLVPQPGPDADLRGRQSVTFKGPAVRVVAEERGGPGGRHPAAEVGRGCRTAEVPESSPTPSARAASSTSRAGSTPPIIFMPIPISACCSANAIDWAASGPAPITVEAPMCVHSTLMRQSNGGSERLIVHLYSDLNTTAFHAMPDDDVPLREEVVPIHDIRITFAPGYRLGRVHLEPEGRDLKVEPTPGGPSVVVPRLDVHAMVVAELEGAGLETKGPRPETRGRRLGGAWDTRRARRLTG